MSLTVDSASVDPAVLRYLLLKKPTYRWAHVVQVHSVHGPPVSCNSAERSEHWHGSSGGGLGVCLCVSVWEYLSIKKKEKKRFQYLRIMCPGAGVINHSNEPLQACFCHDPFQPHLLPRASGKLYLLTEKVILAAQISQLECAVLMPLGFL